MLSLLKIIVIKIKYTITMKVINLPPFNIVKSTIMKNSECKMLIYFEKRNDYFSLFNSGWMFKEKFINLAI